MSEDDKSPGASNVLNPPSSSSGSNAAAPSTFSPSTSSARSPDAMGVTKPTPSTDTESTKATEGAGHPKASGASSAVVGKEDATSNVGDKVAMVRDKLADAGNTVKDRYRVVSESTDDFIHESPWKAIALAALTGVIVGMLAAR
jgi:ElaB protein